MFKFKGSIKNAVQFFFLAALMLTSQACSGGNDSNENADREPDLEASQEESTDDSHASFTVSGAQQGQKQGAAKVVFFEYSRYETRLEITDSDDATEQTFMLHMRADANEILGVPEPGEYPLVSRRDLETGFEGGFDVTYTHIIENNGGRYANVALEYDVPSPGRLAPGASVGTVIIESVDEDYISGRFEFELRESGSINDAPRNDEKVLAVTEGRFKALIEQPQ